MKYHAGQAEMRVVPDDHSARGLNDRKSSIKTNLLHFCLILILSTTKMSSKSVHGKRNTLLASLGLYLWVNIDSYWSFTHFMTN